MQVCHGLTTFFHIKEVRDFVPNRNVIMSREIKKRFDSIDTEIGGFRIMIKGLFFGGFDKIFHYL